MTCSALSPCDCHYLCSPPLTYVTLLKPVVWAKTFCQGYKLPSTFSTPSLSAFQSKQSSNQIPLIIIYTSFNSICYSFYINATYFDCDTASTSAAHSIVPDRQYPRRLNFTHSTKQGTNSRSKLGAKTFHQSFVEPLFFRSQ